MARLLELGGIPDPLLQRNLQALDRLLIDTGGESVGVRFGVEQVLAGATDTIVHGLGRAPVCVLVSPSNGGGVSTPLVVTAFDDTDISVKNTSATDTNAHWLVIG